MEDTRGQLQDTGLSDPADNHSYAKYIFSDREACDLRALVEICRVRSWGWGWGGQGCMVCPGAEWGLDGAPAFSHTPAWTEQRRAGWLLLSRSLTRPIC